MSAFIGRDQEIRTLTGLLRGGATAGQAIMLIGEPGIGKSALLSVAADAARGAGYEVLTATGVESETQLPFAGLHQILHPVPAFASRLGAAHRRALLAAFGLSDGPSPEFL